MLTDEENHFVFEFIQPGQHLGIPLGKKWEANYGHEA